MTKTYSVFPTKSTLCSLIYVTNITGYAIMQNKALMFDSSIFLQFLLSLPQKYLSAVLYTLYCLYTYIAIALGETLGIDS